MKTYLTLSAILFAFCTTTFANFAQTSIRIDTISQIADYNGNGEPDIFEDFNGSGTPDAFEDFNGSGIPDAFEDFNGNGEPDIFEDFNGNGTPDAFEDYSGNGTPDAFEDFNGNGTPDAFEDFNGSGIPDAFEDFNGNDIPDAFEDFSGSYVPDCFETEFADTTGSGVPDFFEGINASKVQSSTHPNANESYINSVFECYWNTLLYPGSDGGYLWLVNRNPCTAITLHNGIYASPGTESLSVQNLGFGAHWFHLHPLDASFNPIDMPAAKSVFKFTVDIQTPLITSNSHPDGAFWYNDKQFECSWVSQEGFKSISGWRWFIDSNPDTIVTEANSTFFNYNKSDIAVSVVDMHGEYWFHLAPVDKESRIITERQSSYKFNVNNNSAVIASTSHPDQNISYGLSNVQLAWSVADVSTGSLIYYFAWNNMPYYEPQSTDGVSPSMSRNYMAQPDGSHYFHVVGIDKLGNRTRASHFRVNINEITGQPAGPGSAPVADFAADQTGGSASLKIQFTDRSENQVSGWLWDFDNDGLIDSTEQNPTHTFTRVGSYSVRLTVTGPGGNDSILKTNYIDVSPSVAAFDADITTGNAPLTVQFTDQSDDNVSSWQWDFDNDGTIDSTVQNPTHTYSAPGVYSVRLRITGAGGSYSLVKEDFITVLPPAPIAAFTADKTSGSSPLTVHFTDQSSYSVSQWRWDFDNDGTIDSTARNPVHTFTQAGSYSVRLTVSGEGGSNSTVKTGYINVSLPPAPVAGFSADNRSGDAPLTVQFTDQSTSVVDSWQWDFDANGTIDSTAQNPSHTYNEPGSYAVRLTTTGPGGTDILVRNNYIIVSMPEPPSANFTVDLVSGTTPVEVRFTDNSTGGITHWQWDFGNNGIIDSTEKNPTHVFNVSGIHSVRLTVSGPGGEDSILMENLITALNTPPVVGITQQQIFLNSLSDMAVLDASSSSDINGDNIYYSWREFYGNPHHGLIPMGSESLSKINLYFPSPGRYEFSVRVSDGKDMSAETRTITVYVPGRKGIVGYSPSDGIVRVPDAKIRVHNSASDAQNNTNPVDIAISDSLGRYYLENVSPVNQSTARTYWYKAERAGFVGTEALQMTVRPDPGWTDDRSDQSLGRGSVSTVSGTVKTRQGVPLEGALVSIIPGSGGTVFADSTDISGSFSLSNVPKGSWIVQLQAFGFQPEVRDINVSDNMPGIHFTLSASTQVGTLSGKVYLNGTDRPVEDVKVSLGTGVETYTDNSGSYRFENIPTGRYIVLANKAGFDSKRLTSVAVNPGSNTEDLPISFASRGPTVFGTVTDQQSGRPVRNATVGIRSSNSVLIRSAVTDHTGYYQLKDVPTGDQDFEISAPGYATNSFNYQVAASMSMDAALNRNPYWKEPSSNVDEKPIASVDQSFISMTSMRESFVIDATPSQGNDLVYIWRENADNPQFNLLPTDSQAMERITIAGVDNPGIYRFELQVKSGNMLSDNTAIVTVFAPGLRGNVHASPSDGVFGLNLVTVRAYTNYSDAVNWTSNNLVQSVQTVDNPIGDFKLDNLSTDSYWIVARAQTGSGYNQYGPVRRKVNYSSAARRTKINMPRNEYRFSGKITDSDTGEPLENVRIVIAPGSLSESFRTTTDATGEFRLSHVPRGSGQMVMLMKNGYNTRIIYVDISSDKTQDMTLSPNYGGTMSQISGYITSNYKGDLLPVPYAEVLIGSGIARAITDGNGYYQITDLPPGAYYGTIRKDGYIPSGLADFGYVVLNPDNNEINKTIKFDGNGPTVRGFVLDETDQVVPGVTITILPPLGVFELQPSSNEQVKDGMQLETQSTTQPNSTDQGGFFQLTGVPHGNHEVLLTFPDGRVETRYIFVDGNKEVKFITQTFGGSGTEQDPYLVGSAQDFLYLMSNSDNHNKYFRLTANIDLAGFDFTPIAADWNNPFSGNFDGGGFVISNAVISGEQYDGLVGLFGVLGATGIVKNLGVENIAIDTPNAYFVGGIAGWNYGTIQKCFTSGSIKGNTHVGGISGGISDSAYIGECYSTASVEAINSAAGIAGIGLSNAWIINSYFAGQVFSNGAIGGLVAVSDGLNSSGCVFDADACGFYLTAAGEGIEDYRMMVQDTFVNLGWDFETAWKFSGISRPILKWQPDRNIGTGSIENPYHISTPVELQAFAADPLRINSSAILKSDINMSGVNYQTIAASWECQYTGTFDGNGKTVYNLSIDGKGESLISMFGNVGAGAVIKNLSLHNLNVTSEGGYFIGGIASWCNGTIEKCSVSGIIQGFVQVGSLTAGLDSAGKISNCYSLAQVSTVGYLGGGIASDIVAGATVEFCYFAGDITGDWTGGIAARSAEGAVDTDCFYNDRLSFSAIGMPLSNSELRQTQTYVNSGWNWSIWKQIEGDYPVFQWQRYTADFNDDGSRNYSDLMIFASEWLSDGSETYTDINCDGIVDLEDFIRLSRVWYNEF